MGVRRLQALKDYVPDAETLIDQMNAGLVVRDAQHRIRQVNDRILSWLGYAPRELIGRRIDCLVPEELRELLADVIEHGDRTRDQRARLAVLRRKDGTTFPVVLFPRRLFDANGEPIGGFSIVVELAAVETATPIGDAPDDPRSALHQIALKLRALSLASPGASGATLVLDHPALRDLSQRERSVLELLLDGFRAPAIARKLFLSPYTVRNHLKSIYRKTGVSGQQGLIDLAKRRD